MLSGRKQMHPLTVSVEENAIFVNAFHDEHERPSMSQSRSESLLLLRNPSSPGAGPQAGTSWDVLSPQAGSLSKKGSLVSTTLSSPNKSPGANGPLLSFPEESPRGLRGTVEQESCHNSKAGQAEEPGSCFRMTGRNMRHSAVLKDNDLLCTRISSHLPTLAASEADSLPTTSKRFNRGIGTLGTHNSMERSGFSRAASSERLSTRKDATMRGLSTKDSSVRGGMDFSMQCLKAAIDTSTRAGTAYYSSSKSVRDKCVQDHPMTADYSVRGGLRNPTLIQVVGKHQSALVASLPPNPAVDRFVNSHSGGHVLATSLSDNGSSPTLPAASPPPEMTGGCEKLPQPPSYRKPKQATRCGPLVKARPSRASSFYSTQGPSPSVCNHKDDSAPLSYPSCLEKEGDLKQFPCGGGRRCMLGDEPIAFPSMPMGSHFSTRQPHTLNSDDDELFALIRGEDPLLKMVDLMMDKHEAVDFMAPSGRKVVVPPTLLSGQGAVVRSPVPDSPSLRRSPLPNSTGPPFSGQGTEGRSPVTDSSSLRSSNRRVVIPIAEDGRLTSPPSPNRRQPKPPVTHWASILE
eukprot:gene4600-14791_t